MAAAALDSPRLRAVQAQRIASLFRALGDPARVRLVNLLATSPEPLCVCKLTKPLGLAQATVSHHLKVLVEAGLVVREERGKWTYVALDPAACAELGRIVDFEACCT